MKDKNLARFLLTLFLGWLGSFIINNSSLKPERHTSRTMAYLFLGYFTCGIYSLVAAVCNLTFDPAKAKNIGYISDSPIVETPAYSAPVEEKVIIEEKPIVEEAPITEKKIFIPSESQLEDSVAEDVAPVVEDDKDEPKKAGLFGRLFGRK